MTIKPVGIPVEVQKNKAVKTYEKLKVINPPKVGAETEKNRSTKEVDGKGKEIDLLA